MKLLLNLVGFGCFGFAYYYSFVEVEGVLNNIVVALFGVGMFVMATSYPSERYGGKAPE